MYTSTTQPRNAGPALPSNSPSGQTDRSLQTSDRRSDDPKDISRSIHGDPATLRFSIEGVPFKPFSETFGRHSAYLHVTSSRR